jgi:hypothetical protein
MSLWPRAPGGVPLLGAAGPPAAGEEAPGAGPEGPAALLGAGASAEAAEAAVVVGMTAAVAASAAVARLLGCSVVAATFCSELASLVQSGLWCTSQPCSTGACGMACLEHGQASDRPCSMLVV